MLAERRRHTHRVRERTLTLTLTLTLALTLTLTLACAQVLGKGDRLVVHEVVHGHGTPREPEP